MFLFANIFAFVGFYDELMNYTITGKNLIEFDFSIKIIDIDTDLVYFI